MNWFAFMRCLAQRALDQEPSLVEQCYKTFHIILPYERDSYLQRHQYIYKVPRHYCRKRKQSFQMNTGCLLLSSQAGYHIYSPKCCLWDLLAERKYLNRQQISPLHILVFRIFWKAFLFILEIVELFLYQFVLHSEFADT